MVKEHILIVDDDSDIVRALSIRFQAAGYVVSAACNGLDGIAAAIETRPDVIILDVRLPDVDGLTVLGELLAQEAIEGTRVIMLTANVAEKVKAQAFDMGARFVLEKPYDALKLIQAIRFVLEESPVSI